MDASVGHGTSPESEKIAASMYEVFFERATGDEPIRLPPRWVDAEEKLGSDTKFNFVGTVDTVGGNSGSPAIDKNGNVVGLLFDGNIHSISGSYWYDTELNRSVMVHPQIILRSMETIYDAGHLVDEISGD